MLIIHVNGNGNELVPRNSSVSKKRVVSDVLLCFKESPLVLEIHILAVLFLPLKTEGDKSDIALTLTSYLVGYSGWEHTEICHKSWESSEAKNIKQRFIRF